MPITPFLTTPLLLGNPSLTYLEIPPLCRGANSHPLLSQFGSILNPLTLPIPPFPFQRFPLFKCMPSQDDIAISASHSPIQCVLLKACKMTPWCLKDRALGVQLQPGRQLWQHWPTFSSSILHSNKTTTQQHFTYFHLYRHTMAISNNIIKQYGHLLLDVSCTKMTFLLPCLTELY
jgi:hypothetical protein